jgi:hypothetical protein
VIDRFTEIIGFDRFAVYVFDYGAPTGGPRYYMFGDHWSSLRPTSPLSLATLIKTKEAKKSKAASLKSMFLEKYSMRT